MLWLSISEDKSGQASRERGLGVEFWVGVMTGPWMVLELKTRGPSRLRPELSKGIVGQSSGVSAGPRRGVTSNKHFIGKGLRSSDRREVVSGGYKLFTGRTEKVKEFI